MAAVSTVLKELEVLREKASRSGDKTSVYQDMIYLARANLAQGWLLSKADKGHGSVQGDVRIIYTLAQALQQTGKYQEALELFRQVLYKPISYKYFSDEMIYKPIAQCYYVQNNYLEAFREYVLLKHIAPKNGNYLYWIAMCLIKLGNKKDEIIDQYLSKTLQLNPKHALALFELGKRYYERHLYQNAQVYLSKAYSLLRNHSEVALYWAIMSIELGYYHDGVMKALDIAEKAPVYRLEVLLRRCSILLQRRETSLLESDFSRRDRMIVIEILQAAKRLYADPNYEKSAILRESFPIRYGLMLGKACEVNLKLQKACRVWENVLKQLSPKAQRLLAGVPSVKQGAELPSFIVQTHGLAQQLHDVGRKLSAYQKIFKHPFVSAYLSMERPQFVNLCKFLSAGLSLRWYNQEVLVFLQGCAVLQYPQRASSAAFSKRAENTNPDIHLFFRFRKLLIDEDIEAVLQELHSKSEGKHTKLKHPMREVLRGSSHIRLNIYNPGGISVPHLERRLGPTLRYYQEQSFEQLLQQLTQNAEGKALISS